MYLDERSSLILKAVLSNPDISSTELENTYTLSRRQISYSFTKINQWLEEKNYPAIKRTNSGKFIVSPLLFDLLSKGGKKSATSRYIPSEKERAQFIILMILSSGEELSLLHFSSALEVSKNTALRDIKVVQKLVNGYRLEMVYSRMFGYEIAGNEWDKRKLLIDVLRNIFAIYQGESYIRQLGQISLEEIEKRKHQLEEVEKILHLKFIDEQIKLLPYVMAILLRRIEKGQVINEGTNDSYYIDYEALSDTKEFEAAEILIQDGKSIPKQERLFITLQLLTSNRFSARFFSEHELPQLKKSLEDCLDLFEYKAAITFKDKETLLNRLVLHMKPAYYRIKYNLTTDYTMLERVSSEFKAIHYIVNDSIQPFQDFIGCEIPEQEIMFITIMIGGHLINSGETIPAKKRAVIVCPNGISISQLMEHTLRDLFPEFYFYPAYSIREFTQLELAFDIVFSSVPVQTDKHLFIVNQFISDFEKIQLRQRVMKGVFGLKTTVANIDQMITLIEKYAKITDKQSLEKALKDYFSIQISSEESPKLEYSLADFITPETIVVRDSVETWQAAIELAAQPLLQKGSINQSYIESMKEQYPTLAPHILLRMNVAIPHAKPQDGVNSVSMSLLRIKEGLSIENGKKVHVIVVIAAVDKSQHLNALLQLMKLADMDDVIKKIIQLESDVDIHEVIQAQIRGKA